MKKVLLFAGIVALAAIPAAAGPKASVIGDYVETRTAEVFTGGCIMGMEGETGGRQALMAWRVREGEVAGVRLDGLSVVAAVSGDVNLGMYELGGARAKTIKAALMVDARATEAQRDALVSLARSLSNGVISDIVDVRVVPIRFERGTDLIQVEAGDAALSVGTKLTHDPSCGALQWFRPLATMADSEIGLTRRQAFDGDALGARWSQVDRKSAFFGTFQF